MNHSASTEQSLTAVGGDEIYDDDGDVIGTRVSVVEDGLAAAPERDGLIQAFTLLRPNEVADMVANRAIIERAKGMLMLIYDIDAERAFELLKWRSQDTNVKLRSLAQQLIEEFPRLTNEQHLLALEGYDRVLLTRHRRRADST